jgi:hypothetical protein
MSNWLANLLSNVRVTNNGHVVWERDPDAPIATDITVERAPPPAPREITAGRIKQLFKRGVVGFALHAFARSMVVFAQNAPRTALMSDAEGIAYGGMAIVATFAYAFGPDNVPLVLVAAHSVVTACRFAGAVAIATEWGNLSWPAIVLTSFVPVWLLS